MSEIESDIDESASSDTQPEKESQSAAPESKQTRVKKQPKKFDFERNERTIFVGNLPSTFDHGDVEKLFKCCGPVESARIRSVVPEKEKLAPKVAQITKRIHPKVDSVNAYLVFTKTDDNEVHVKKALAMNGKLVMDHHIRVDRAQRPNSKRLTLTSRKKSVFVGNIRFDLRDDDLINHFQTAGEVDYVRIVRDRATGLGKGFGFVKFMERAAVKEALGMNDTNFKGRQLRVKKVEDDMKLDDNSKEKKPANRNESQDSDDYQSQPAQKKVKFENQGRSRTRDFNYSRNHKGHNHHGVNVRPTDFNQSRNVKGLKPHKVKFESKVHVREFNKGPNKHKVESGYKVRQGAFKEPKDKDYKLAKVKMVKKDKKKTILKKKVKK